MAWFEKLFGKSPEEKQLESQKRTLEKKRDIATEQIGEIDTQKREAIQTGVTQVQGQAEQEIDRTAEQLAQRGEITGAGKADIMLQGQEKASEQKAEIVKDVSTQAAERTEAVRDDIDIIETEISEIDAQLEEAKKTRQFGTVASLVGGGIDIAGALIGIPPGFGSAAASIATGINQGDMGAVTAGIQQGLGTIGQTQVAFRNRRLRSGMDKYSEKVLSQFPTMDANKRQSIMDEFAVASATMSPDKFSRWLSDYQLPIKAPSVDLNINIDDPYVDYIGTPWSPSQLERMGAR